MQLGGFTSFFDHNSSLIVIFLAERDQTNLDLLHNECLFRRADLHSRFAHQAAGFTIDQWGFPEMLSAATSSDSVNLSSVARG